MKAGDRTSEREVTVGGGHVSGELGWLHTGIGSADQAEVRVRLARRHGRPVDDHERPVRAGDDHARRILADALDTGGLTT